MAQLSTINTRSLVGAPGRLEVANRGRFEAEMGSKVPRVFAASESRNRVRYKRRVLRVAEVPSSRVATELPPRNVQVESTFRIGS